MESFGPQLIAVAFDRCDIDGSGERHRPKSTVAGDIGELQIIHRRNKNTLSRPVADSAGVGRAIPIRGSREEGFNPFNIATALREFGKLNKPFSVEALFRVLVDQVDRYIVAEPGRIRDKPG